MTVSAPELCSPPLNALRAFEAAARHGSFTAAAAELCVTPGAVAQQIKSLEAWLGSQLFVRHSQGVQLTPLAKRSLPDFSNAFDALGEAVSALRSEVAPQNIRIAALPSIAQLWLSPRLPELRQLVRDTTLSVTAMEDPPNMHRDFYDLSIFFESYPLGKDSIELERDRIFPVCSPAVATTLLRPSDLAGATFLHDSSWADDWNLWVKAALSDKVIDTCGPIFSLYSLAVEEAINGAGVLIGHEALVRHHLESGALVEPLSIRIELNSALSINIAYAKTGYRTIDEIIGILTESSTGE